MNIQRSRFSNLTVGVSRLRFGFEGSSFRAKDCIWRAVRRCVAGQVYAGLGYPKSIQDVTSS